MAAAAYSGTKIMNCEDEMISGFVAFEFSRPD